MSGPVMERSVLVTGAAGGIGRATALEAARRGARLVITDIQDERLAETADEITRLGGTVLTHAAVDLTDHDAVVAFAAAVHEAHGSLDVVMNVAGASTWGSVDRLSHADWRKMVEVDLMGPISVIEAFVPAMMDGGRGGHLVNVSSSAGLIGLPWHAAYSAAKFGLRGVSEVLRFDLEPHGIGVTLVCPGGVNTPMVETVDIVGVNRDHPAVRNLIRWFRRTAVSPESVATRILDAVDNDTYLVFTSIDIRALFWLQRFLPPAYRLIMRRLNRELTRVAEQAKLDG